MARIIIVPLACTVTPDPRDRAESKKKLGLLGKQVVTMFGYISRSKGYDMAVKAMQNPNVPRDVVLYIAGAARTLEDRVYEEELKRHAQMCLPGRVFFHGYVEDADIPVVMSATDIVLMPYYHIVQSSAVNHALAYHVPVIASGIGGFVEIAREYGCIQTFKPGCQEDMEAKLLELLSNQGLRDNLAHKSERYIVETGIGKICEDIEKIYTEILLG